MPAQSMPNELWINYNQLRKQKNGFTAFQEAMKFAKPNIMTLTQNINVTKHPGQSIDHESTWN